MGSRYLPPHLRDKLANGDAASTELRGLDHHHQASQVRLVVPSSAEFDAASCPLDIEEAAAGEAPAEHKALTIFFPEKLPDELLEWFKKAFEETNARLEFPTDLSKQERAKWHSQAHRKGLSTESQGVGDSRFLSILSPAAAADGDAAREAEKPHLNRSQRHRAQQIYDFCQLEGGRFWDYSKGELEDMVASGQPLPADLAEMVDRREKGSRVSQLLRAGEPAEALQMLFDNPKLAWQKDEFSGGYPIHIATFKGYKTVVQYLASLPNVVEQRDGQRETPLAIAMRRGQADMEKLLLEAGADPGHANFHRDLCRGEGSSEEEEYVSWNRAERRAYKHGGEGGPGRRRASLDAGRRTSMDAGGRRTSMDGHGRRTSMDGHGRRTSMDLANGKAGSGGRGRRSVELPASSHCPW